MDPQNCLNKYQKANTLVKLSKYHEAIKELEQLHQLMPKEAPVLTLLGMVECALLRSIRSWVRSRSPTTTSLKLWTLSARIPSASRGSSRTFRLPANKTRTCDDHDGDDKRWHIEYSHCDSGRKPSKIPHHSIILIMSTFG